MEASMSDATVVVECQIKRDTGNAILVVSTDTGLQEWVPLSQVDRIDHKKNGLADVTMKEWIAIKKGLV